MFHKRPRHIILYALLNTLTLAGVWSCRKDVDSFRPYPPTIEAIHQLLEQVPSASTRTSFLLSGAVPDTILATPGGVRVFLTDNENLFADADDNPVPCSTCQTLRVEVTEVLGKSDIIAYGVPTATTAGELLESGGMVRVVVTCNGEQLKLLPDRKLKIQIPADNPVDDMFVFGGIMENDDIFAGWEDTGLPVFQAEWLAANLVVQTGYELFSPTLEWINCDRFINEQTTSFCVDLPASFNPENTQAYLVFKNIRAVVPLEINLGKQTFCFDNAPHGYQIEIVTVSKTTDGKLWLGNAETEIGTNATVPVEPQEVSQQQMINFLKSL